MFSVRFLKLKLTILSDDPPDHLRVDVHVATHESLTPLNAVSSPHEGPFAQKLPAHRALRQTALERPRCWAQAVHRGGESSFINKVASKHHAVVDVHLLASWGPLLLLLRSPACACCPRVPSIRRPGRLLRLMGFHDDRGHTNVFRAVPDAVMLLALLLLVQT